MFASIKPSNAFRLAIQAILNVSIPVFVRKQSASTVSTPSFDGSPTISGQHKLTEH